MIIGVVMVNPHADEGEMVSMFQIEVKGMNPCQHIDVRASICPQDQEERVREMGIGKWISQEDLALHGLKVIRVSFGKDEEGIRLVDEFGKEKRENGKPN